MSKILLRERASAPDTPTAGQLAAYAKTDKQFYFRDDEGTERRIITLDDGPFSGFRNAIIGGDFSTNPWQRGTSFTSVSNGAFTADRWQYAKSGAMVHDITKASDAPTVAQAGRLTNHCLMADCTTADGSLAATDSCRIQQAIEGYNFLPFAQRTFTLSFWHKHTKTGTYCVAFRNSGDDRSYVAEYTQDVSDTWEKATITVTASPSAGTWDYTNGVGLYVTFTLAAGSNYQTTAGSWQTGSYWATANQVNACDSTSNNFRIALVQLEPGRIVTPFENRLIQIEETLCKRYFYNGLTVRYAGPTTGAYGCNYTIAHPVKMRTAPTINFSNTSVVNNVTTISANSITTVGFTASFGTNGAGGGTAQGDVEASAEL